jgi:AraC family transcriptional regulator
MREKKMPSDLTDVIRGRVVRTERVGELTLTETSYPPGSVLPAHLHEQACFGLVLHGEYSEEYPSKTLACRSRGIFFRPPRIVHTNRFDRPGARCFYVEVSSSWLEHVQECCALVQEPTVSGDMKLQWLATKMYRQWRNMDEAGRLDLEGLALEAAAEFARGGCASSERQPPKWLTEVHELLRIRFAEVLRLQDIALVVGVHPVHLCKQFRRHYGFTVGDFLRRCRIDFACEQLRSSKLSIAEIALDAGFAHQAHFTSVFKRLTGMSPREYRRGLSSWPSPKILCTQ